MSDESRKSAIRKMMRLKRISKTQATALVDEMLREIQARLNLQAERKRLLVN